MRFVSFFLLLTRKEIQILARNKIELIILIYLGLSCGRRVRRTVVICQGRDCFPAKKIMCFFQKSVFRENVIKHYESVLQPWPKLQIPQDPRNWQTNAHCDRSHYIGASELTARHDSQKARNVWTSCRCSYFATVIILWFCKMELIKWLFHLSGELCLLSPCAVNYQMAEVHCELHN